MNIRNRNIFIIALAMFFTFSSIVLQPGVSASSGKAPSIEKASLAVSKLDPSLKVLSIHPTAMPELWEIVIELKNKQKTVVYLNPEKNLLFAGTLFDINSRVNLTKVRQDDLNRVDFASISVEGDIVLGNPAAKKKVIVFDDPD